MVLTYAAKVRNAKKNYQRHIDRKNAGAPIRSKRKPSSPLPASKDRISRSKLLKRLHEDLPTSTPKKTAVNELSYQRILLPDEIEDIDQLYVTEEQIDKMFRAIHTASNNEYKVKFFSADEILSNASQLPSIQDTDIIVVPIPLRSNGQINLAVFELSTSYVWLFCRYYEQKHYTFDKIKAILMEKYNINFILLPKNACDKLINKIPYWYNDTILVFRTAEELFFTGTVKKFDNFDLDAERKRYSEIYDMLHSDDWDGIWPPTLQIKNCEVIDSDENSEEEDNDDSRNGISAASNDNQAVESFQNYTGTNTSHNTINEAQPSISDFYDFDDVQSPRSPIPHQSISSLSSEKTQSSSSSHAFSSNNVVNNRLNASVLPHNRQLVSYSVSTTSTTSDQNSSNHGNKNRVPSITVSLQPDSTENDSNVFSSIYSQSTSNNESINNNGEIDVELPPNETEDSDEGSYPTIGSGFSSDVNMESSASNDSIASTATAVPRIIENYNFNLNWRRSLSPHKCSSEEFEYSSLSSVGSSSDLEDNEEIDVQLSPRYYNDTNDSSQEERIDIYTATDLDLNCRFIRDNVEQYWKTVRKLAEDRQKIIRIIKKRLEPEQYLRFDNDEEVIRINAISKLLEHDLNSYIPAVPHWKVSYQNGSDKKIIIRKGFIYERIEETNTFECIYKKEELFEQCRTFIEIDNSDTIINGSFCYHNHPAADNEKYTNDFSPPRDSPISFRPVTKEGEKWGKYEKLMAFLKETLNELNDWRRQAIICEERLKVIKQYLSQLEAAEHPNNKIGIRCKMVILEAKNLLNCIRLDK